ncbi:hypothetical protein B0H16DRAFT_1510774 [Mycena metata]|uniref:Uncharacterized protein n=1 Tax=Mycena metata TaxID=1033252 RepID=A0AAD7JXY9_9AGAR|nr:hypothetical protein B0H16DRAFT_1510774 [Mycena metata]
MFVFQFPSHLPSASMWFPGGLYLHRVTALDSDRLQDMLVRLEPGPLLRRSLFFLPNQVNGQLCWVKGRRVRPGWGREGRPCCPHLQRGCGWSEFVSYRGLPRVYVRVFLSFNAFVIQYSIFNADLSKLQEYCRKCSFESSAGHEVESRSLLLQLKLEVETAHRAGPRTRSLGFYIGGRTRIWKKRTWSTTTRGRIVETSTGAGNLRPRKYASAQAPGKLSEGLSALFSETP